MTDRRPFLRIIDSQATPEWGTSQQMTGHSVPGLAVTATISWTDESGQKWIAELSGLLTPKGVSGHKLN